MPYLLFIYYLLLLIIYLLFSCANVTPSTTHTQQYTPLHTPHANTHTHFIVVVQLTWLLLLQLFPLLQCLQYNCIFCINIFCTYNNHRLPAKKTQTDIYKTHSNDNKLNLKQLKQVPNPAVLIVSMKRKSLFKTKSNRNRNNQRLTTVLFCLLCSLMFQNEKHSFVLPICSNIFKFVINF